MSIMKKIFGDPNEKVIKQIRPFVDRVNALETSIKTLTDDGLKQKTLDFKERLAKGETLDDLLPEAFAVAREASWRNLKQRQYDVQLIGGYVLHRGQIAEMRTGEGKTLTAVAPVYVNALEGRGVHVITVNDYLARRDTVWMGQVYHALGLTVGCVQHESGYLYDPEFKAEPQHDENRDETGSFKVDMDYLRPVSRQEAYAADITYGTNNEFGFDYLRDNMVGSVDQMVQRGLNFAIIDEVDSILIDEARTPLIISGPAEESSEMYYRFAELVPRLEVETDYVIDEKLRSATITGSGIAKMEQWLGIENLYAQGGVKLVHHLENALRAHSLYKKDKDYVVKEGEVLIVDEFTGRLMVGRRYSEGLHQAIEAKERVSIQRESITLATITFQNYFRMYNKLAGMTGTALTEAEEFYKIYKLEVVEIPTNKTSQRKDFPDRVYKNEKGKFQAVVQEIKRLHESGQPVLVGTASIEKNEILGELLKMEGIPYNLLNAKNHEKEGEWIAQAGRPGAVTVATNMAGRGVDIILGGNPPTEEQAGKVRGLGGLHVLGTERHESRRIDNQLRGRAGRQGDPGTTQFYVSLEDDLMRIFGSDNMKKRMDQLRIPDDQPIESKVLSKAIESAQRKVEGHHFDVRKHLLEYDDVINKHRLAIYTQRRQILEDAARATVEGERPLKTRILEAVESEIEQTVFFHTGAEDPSFWSLEEVAKAVNALLPAEMDVTEVMSDFQKQAEGKQEMVELRTKIIEACMDLARRAYTRIEESVIDMGFMADIEKRVLLRAYDDLWIEHLDAIDHLRRGIGLQGYAQHDPLVEYKREAYRMFNQLNSLINKQVAHAIFKIPVAQQVVMRQFQNAALNNQPMILQGAAKTSDQLSAGQTDNKINQDPKYKDVGRNDACPCGSGKKFKKCHGA
ncbi:MAG: preprotein translocase subunit SecA [Parcubacteria group bacterium ADurb.Bin192]|nr:MAG: preprotein translocase subunit SecA [Parcubacteria group bacterium ADurb.Bin192]